MAPLESPTLESLSENQQTPSCITVGLSSRVPSKVPPASGDLCKDQPAPEGLSEDWQPAEDPGKDLTAGEISKDLLAVASPSEDPLSEIRGNIIDLTGSDSEDECERSTSDGRHRPSPSPEFEITYGEFDSEQDTRASSHDSDHDIVEVTTKRPSNSSKRSLKAADDEVDGQAISHKRLKADKDTSLPDGQDSLQERSLRDSMNTESGWLDAALQSSEKFCQLSLDRTVQFSKLIELEAETAKLLNDISTEDWPQQLRKLIEQLRKVEERRRGFTDMLYRNVILEYGECSHMKDTIEQWILEETKVSKRIERSG